MKLSVPIGVYGRLLICGMLTQDRTKPRLVNLRKTGASSILFSPEWSDTSSDYERRKFC